jgi:hypothetical protein
MRTFLVTVLLLVASVSYGQITEQMYRGSLDSGYVTTTKKKIQFSGTYQKIIRVDIDHDTTGYGRTPLLYYAFEDDTTNTYRSFLRPGDSIRHDGLGITHLYIWSSTGTVPYRVIIYR